MPRRLEANPQGHLELVNKQQGAEANLTLFMEFKRECLGWPKGQPLEMQRPINLAQGQILGANQTPTLEMQRPKDKGAKANLTFFMDLERECMG